MDFRNTPYTRGIRNNNPGNLEKRATDWQGKVPHSQNTDSRFEQFDTIENGLRALMINVHTKVTRDKLDTLAKIISVWAPPSENNTQGYIARVSKALGISPTAPLTADSFTKDFYITLARAIAQIECHPDHTRIPESSYQAAYDMIPLAKKALKKK